MAPSILRISGFCLTLSLFISPITAVPAASASQVSCPTITKTTANPHCPPPTTTACATPDCILLSVIDVPCGCPTIVPTSTDFTVCPTGCQGGCGTFYETNIATCPSTKTKTTCPSTHSTITSSKTTDTCVTITQTTGSACPTITDCTTADCILEKTITLECGCASIFTKTQCQTACNEGCATAYDTVYIPCPYSSSPPVVTTAGGTTAARSVPVLTVPT